MKLGTLILGIIGNVLKIREIWKGSVAAGKGGGEFFQYGRHSDYQTIIIKMKQK